MSDAHVVARRQLLDQLRIDLVGPADPEEELVESPMTRYVCGLLAPYGTSVDRAEVRHK